jgi:hypothetical protein
MKRLSIFLFLTVIIFGLLSVSSCKKESKDTTPPVITLLGSATMYVAKDSAFIDPGATASDDIDGDISAKIVITNPVQIHTEGTYTVKYNVSDEAGNDAVEVKRTVIVTIF